MLRRRRVIHSRVRVESLLGGCCVAGLDTAIHDRSQPRRMHALDAHPPGMEADDRVVGNAVGFEATGVVERPTVGGDRPEEVGRRTRRAIGLGCEPLAVIAHVLAVHRDLGVCGAQRRVGFRECALEAGAQSRPFGGVAAAHALEQLAELRQSSEAEAAQRLGGREHRKLEPYGKWAAQALRNRPRFARQQRPGVGAQQQQRHEQSNAANGARAVHRSRR
jgi:hypothetical protein